MTKLRLSDGAKLWETTFDATPDLAAQCSPGDLRKQECVYRITEAADGGLVISGNTSRNFDDAYLAKIFPDCQSKANYMTINSLLDANNEYHVSGAVTFSSSMNIHGKVIIPAGASLTLNNNAVFRFADSKKLDHPTRIIVEAGGKLNVSNATLSSLNTCPLPVWDGVVVKGDPLASQYPDNNCPQGKATFSAATVEHARLAVSTANEFVTKWYMADYQPIASGGIVTIAGSTFRNNLRDVLFSPYENHAPTPSAPIMANRSSIGNSTFSSTQVLNHKRTPGEHVTLFGVRGINIAGCTFSNFVVTFDPMLELVGKHGTGIRSINSTFKVLPTCSQPIVTLSPCPPQYVVRSTFTDLWMGISASTFDLSRTFEVDQADMVRCFEGINMSGIQDASITRNSFLVGEPTGSILTPLGPAYGIYSNQCTGYRIEENTFTGQSNGHEKVGVTIKNSGAAPNRLYNNVFNNFTSGRSSTATVVMGTNSNKNHVDGLQIKCNDYGQDTRNTYDVALTSTTTTLAGQQGAAMDPLDPTTVTRPAGNRFSWDCSSAENDYHVKYSSNVFEYWHHNTGTSDRVKPQCYDASYLIPMPAGGFFTSRNLACPSSLSHEDHEVKRMAAQEAHGEREAIETEYVATKDAGDTESLLAFVSNPAYSSASKRNALLSTAPEVGSEVFAAAFACDPPLSAWHLTQALVACSPLQGVVLKMTQESGLDPFYTAIVEDAQDGSVNVLSLLESEMAEQGQLKGAALYDLGRMAWTDTLTFDEQVDSLLLLHAGIPALNTAWAKAGALYAKGDLSGLEALASAQQGVEEAGVTFTVQEKLAQAEQMNGWAAADAATVTGLEELAAQEAVGSAHAQAWLHALGAPMPEVLIELPEEDGMPKRMVISEPTVASDRAALMAYPNPSEGPVWVVYSTPVDAEQATLRIHDLTGRLLLEQRVAMGSSGLVELDNSSWPNGAYLGTLYADGLRIGHVKLLAQH